MLSESYIEVEEGTGKRLRTALRTVGANQVHEEIVALVDVPSGTILSTTIPTVALPVRLTDGTNFYTASGGASTVTVSNTVEVTATSLDIRTITETIPISLGAEHDEDSAHVHGDKGVMLFAIREDHLEHSHVDSEGDYVPLSVNELGGLYVEAQQHRHVDECDSTVGWTVLGDDTDNLSTTANHVLGSLALEFDKVDGSDNTSIAGVQKTFSETMILTDYHEGGGFWVTNYYVSDITNIDYVFLRAGSDSVNYTEWRISDDLIVVGWNDVRISINTPHTFSGNGWNSDLVNYISAGVSFDNETSTLSNIAIDHIDIMSGFQVNAALTAQITSNVSSPNVIVRKWGNAVDTNIGNVGNNVLRVVNATDDPNLGSITTALYGSGTLAEITNIPSTLSFDLKVDSVGLLKSGETISTDRTWTISETIPISATDLDIRDITETIPVNVVDISHTCTWASTFGTQGTTTVWDPSGNQVRIKYVSYSNRTGVSGRVNLEYNTGDEILPITLGSLGIFASNIVSGNVQGDTLSMVIDTAAMTVDVFVIGEEI